MKVIGKRANRRKARSRKKNKTKQQNRTLRGTDTVALVVNPIHESKNT
jgi:hypothetical protein